MVPPTILLVPLERSISMSRGHTKLVWSCLHLMVQHFWISNNFVKKKSTKLNIFRKCGKTFSNIGKFLMSEIFSTYFIIFTLRWGRYWILRNFSHYKLFYFILFFEFSFIMKVKVLFTCGLVTYNILINIEMWILPRWQILTNYVTISKHGF
jgi:hypothetical protein